MLEIHEKKNRDYANEEDPFSNFRFAGYVSSQFTGTHASFANLIGVKLARLTNLLEQGRVPQNESITDTFLDLTTYCALWASFYEREKLNAELRAGSGKSKCKVNVRRRSTRTK